MTPLEKLLLEELPTVTLTGTFGGPGALPARRGPSENPPPDPDAAEHLAALDATVNPTRPRTRRTTTAPPRHLHVVPPTAA